jgi:hypothetical protein
VNRFWEDAVSVFETACNAPRENATGELNMLIDSAGALRMAAGEGWQPGALQAHYGARSVFQVTHTADGVRVTARSRAENCVLQSAKPASMLAALGSGLAQYRVVGADQDHRFLSSGRLAEAGRNAARETTLRVTMKSPHGVVCL